MNNYDLVIIGGGIMGLMTAYFASGSTRKIVILENRTIGNNQAASFSYTRTIRTDYLDPFYARLANESRELWLNMEQQSGKRLLIKAGCLNIAKKSITPELSGTYGSKSFEVISKLNYGPEKLTKKKLQKRFPQFEADAGYLDNKGGYLDLVVITEFIVKILKERGVTFAENIQTESITEIDSGVRIMTKSGTFNTKKLILTTGMWTNDILKRIKGNNLVLPIRLDRPKECKYFYPSPDKLEMFLPANFPVFAYLDVGIYGHPVFDRMKGAVKISYYNPPDLAFKANKKINSVMEFVNECIPALQDVIFEDVVDADRCYYDLVSDDNFILGRLPDYNNIVLGTGWRGTGYKFAPLVGKILSQLSLQSETVYNITKFSPGRFVL